MSPSTTATMTAQTNDILTEGNYFLWAYGTTMKALAIVFMRLSPPFQMMVRSATTAMEAWLILERYFVKRNLRNRINLRKKLHELRMVQGEDISEHMLKFDNLLMAMEAIGDFMDEDEKLVVLLGSLSSEYDALVRVIENKPGVDLLEAKEMLRREYERMQEREVTETALRVGRPVRGKFGPRRHGLVQGKGKAPLQKKKQSDGGKFNGKCFRCNKYGHKEANCPSAEGSEHVFSATSAPISGWLVDSGATSHMSFEEHDFVTYKRFAHGTPVEMADGNQLYAVASGSVRFKANNGSRVTLTQVLHVPGLDKRLISVSALTEKDVEVHFKRDSCVISYEGKPLLQVPRVAKSYTVHAEAASSAHARLDGRVMERDGGDRDAFGDLFGDAFGDSTDNEDEMSNDDGGEEAETTGTSTKRDANVPAVNGEDLELWHARIMHVGDSRLTDIVRACDGVPASLADNKPGQLCDACVQGKMCVERYPRSVRSAVKTTGPLEVVHSDVMGPMRVPSFGKAKYAVTFVDDYSRFTAIYFMKSKSEVLTQFKTFKAWIENQLSRRIKCIRSDNGGEYVNRNFASFCQQHGLTHQLTVPYSPQQNGVAERMNRTIADVTRSAMIHRAMTQGWWAEVMAAAVHVLNRIPTTVRPGRSPFELCFGVRPSLSHLRVIGSEGYAHIDKSKRGKLEAKAFRCVLLGYSETTKGYRVWNKEANKLEVVRSVVLREVDSPRLIQVVPGPDRVVVPRDDDRDVVAKPKTSNNPQPMDVDDEGPHHEPQPLVETPPAMPQPLYPMQPEPPAPVQRQPEATLMQQQQPQLEYQSAASPLVFHPPVRRIGRQTVAALPAPVEDRLGAVPSTAPAVENQLVLRPENAVVVGGDRRDGDINQREQKRPRLLPAPEQANAVSEVPTSYQAAMQSADASDWQAAVRRELLSLGEHGVWELVRPPEDAHIVGCKWVFALKRNEKGEVVRYKARLVAQGFSQAFGIDYNETYSPVAALSSIRILLALCCQLGYIVHQCDVETAFLHGQLKETIYMRVPDGVDHGPDQVCRLKRSLYGLKQASAVWYQTITKIFAQISFKACTSDPCVFVKRAGRDFIYISLYVDDLLIFAKHEHQINAVKDQLKQHFKMKDLGPAKYVIGMEIQHDVNNRVMTIKQSQFVRRLIEKFNQNDATPVTNPCDKGQLMMKIDGEPSAAEQERMSKRPYRSLIGALQYLAMGTRPDIAYAVSFLSRFAEKPREVHWNAAIRIVRYLKGTINMGIIYKGNDGPVTFGAWSDSDWASDTQTRRSTSGLLLTMNGAPIVFKSKLQRTVALSTAEAEYTAISMCAQEVLWVRTLLEELGLAQNEPTTIHTDNKSAIAIAKNVGYSARSKHVDIRYHFVRGHLTDGVIELHYVKSTSQLADYLTKPIEGKTFQRLVAASGLQTTS